MSKKVTNKNLMDFIYKKEAERTKKEKIFRTIVCIFVIIYTAILGYMLINANANLAEAEAEYADTEVGLTLNQ